MSHDKKYFIRTGGVAQLVDCLPNKCEAEFKPNTEEKKIFYYSLNIQFLQIFINDVNIPLICILIYTM